MVFAIKAKVNTATIYGLRALTVFTGIQQTFQTHCNKSGRIWIIVTKGINMPALL